MHIEIKDNGGVNTDYIFEPLKVEGFFVATVGETAHEYLSGRIFSLDELSCCSPVTFVKVREFSDYIRCVDDEKEAASRLEKDTRDLAASCHKKQLYVLSEIEDLYAAKQCCELARNTGELGYSVLITHEKAKYSQYISEICSVFNHIIFLPDDATYVVEVLRWLICGFIQPGCIGIDYSGAHYVLTSAKESYCSKIQYKDAATLKDSFGDFLTNSHVACEKGQEVVNRLFGVWVPHDFDLYDVMELADEIKQISPGEVMQTCLFNENKNDKTWAVILLSAVSKKVG